MSEMVERVACAMWCDYLRSASPPVQFHKKDEMRHWLNTASEHDRVAWRRSARAAIAAMREPTDGMKAVEGVHWDYSCGVCGGVKEGWQTMIDEALQ